MQIQHLFYVVYLIQSSSQVQILTRFQNPIGYNAAFKVHTISTWLNFIN